MFEVKPKFSSTKGKIEIRNQFKVQSSESRVRFGVEKRTESKEQRTENKEN